MIRPELSGVITGPLPSLADIQVASCPMTPYRDQRCKQVDITRTDAQGRFSFDSVNAWYLPHDLPCGERPLTLVVICHPDAERLHVELRPDGGERAEKIPLQVYTKAFSEFDGFKIRERVSPETLCAGRPVNP